MTSINIETLLTIVYVLVDDWYLAKGSKFLVGKVGRKPRFSDSEMMCLMIAEDYIPYPAETQYIEFIRANHCDLFPELLSQSQFNRRARQLRLLVEELRREWLRELAVLEEGRYLLDTKPVPVVGYKRTKSHSEFRGSADYGYCASRKLFYFGYKLVMVSTLDGLPIVYDLVPANTDERQAAEVVLAHLNGVEVIGDKGFLGEDWQAEIYEQTKSVILTPKRKNQKKQHDKAFQRLLNSARERIEGVFHEIQNTGRHLEHLLAKTLDGLSARIIAKVTAHLLRYRLKLDFGIDVQTFSWDSEYAF